MKKHVFVGAVIIASAIGILGGQASASSIHTVISGDTLWAIAHDNHVSVEDLFAWNELNSDLIYPSQEIMIEKEIRIYVVKRGDTLSEIAWNNAISLEELMRWNQISGHLIYPGDQLTLEESTTFPEKTTKKTISTTQEPKTQIPALSQPITKKVAPVAKTSTPTKEMIVEATAYTAYCDGCSGTTYTGIDLRSNPNQKVIAVDPSVIPLGSLVWVEGYGEAIAGDIGGAIKGNRIDVFLEDEKDAYTWGRKTVTIRILE